MRFSATFRGSDDRRSSLFRLQHLSVLSLFNCPEHLIPHSHRGWVPMLSAWDYCNSVLAGLPRNLLNKLQTVINSACVLFEDGRTHHTVAERSSLAAHPRKGYFQTVCHVIQMPTQPGTSLSVWSATTGLASRVKTAPQIITRRPSDPKIDAWRPSVSSFRRQSMEQSAVNRHRRFNFVFFPPSLKNSFIYCFISILTYNLSR